MLAWLDFDAEAMKRAHELLQQFRDARTLDHLRLSGVRDDFADYFFPATSTIMPHARYLILVPRAFLTLESEINKKGYSLQQAMKRLDEIEAEQAKKLIAQLARNERKDQLDRKDLEGSGIIGWDKLRESKNTEFVSQTPSNNYWASLRKLQIRLPNGSRGAYIRNLLSRSKLKGSRLGVPEEEASGLESVIWHKDAMELARDSSELCLELNRNQARFIHRQYVGLESLMSRLLLSDFPEFDEKGNLQAIDYVWDYPYLPDTDRAMVETAMRLSALIQGANLVYGALVSIEYGLENHENFSGWRPSLEEWFDVSRSALGANSAKKVVWEPISLICQTRATDIDFLKKIQANLKNAKSVKNLLSLCAPVISAREKSIKTASYRLGRLKGTDKNKYRERILRQPLRLTAPPDFRWSMAREFMWNINQGLKKWG